MGLGLMTEILLFCPPKNKTNLENLDPLIVSMKPNGTRRVTKGLIHAVLDEMRTSNSTEYKKGKLMY